MELYRFKPWIQYMAHLYLPKEWIGQFYMEENESYASLIFPYFDPANQSSTFPQQAKIGLTIIKGEEKEAKTIARLVRWEDGKTCPNILEERVLGSKEDVERLIIRFGEAVRE